MLNCDLEVNEFELQSHYYVNFQTKVWIPLSPPASYELDSITAVFLNDDFVIK